MVWAAGTARNPLLKDLPCTKERGRLVVNKFHEVVKWPGVWALGDCTAVPDASAGKTSPSTAQHVLREGRVLARNIIADSRRAIKEAFRLFDCRPACGDRKTNRVPNIFGVNFSGFIAWWLWRAIYLSKLPRLEKKLRVTVDWRRDLLFSEDIVKFLAASEANVSRTSHEHTPLQRT